MRWVVVLRWRSTVAGLWIVCCEQRMVLALPGKGVEEAHQRVVFTVKITKVRHGALT